MLRKRVGSNTLIAFQHIDTLQDCRVDFCHAVIFRAVIFSQTLIFETHTHTLSLSLSLSLSLFLFHHDETKGNAEEICGLKDRGRWKEKEESPICDGKWNESRFLDQTRAQFARTSYTESHVRKKLQKHRQGDGCDESIHF